MYCLEKTPQGNDLHKVLSPSWNLIFSISLLTSCLSPSYGDTLTGTRTALMQRDTSFPANTQLIMFFHEVDSLVTAACLFDTGADCSFQRRPSGRCSYIRRRFHRVTLRLHQPRGDTHFLLITAHIHLSACDLKRWPFHFPRSSPCHWNRVRLPSSVSLHLAQRSCSVLCRRSRCKSPPPDKSVSLSPQM